ncbi:MAG: ABC transporter permease [bacterium]|nr:ABC transporter permease [bacterium]
MRLITYIGLVVRRVWSKRGILIGSLLGATLVTALLAIVPLYEASVQAVDLLFTVRGATSDSVDVTAFSTYTDYFATGADSNRELVNTSADELLAKWYPERLERTQSREFVVIPLSVDWYGQAEAWREALDQAIEDELDPEEWPQPQYPAPPREPTTARIFTSPTLTDHLTVVAGEIPSELPNLVRDPVQPVQLVLGSDLAATMSVGVGDQFLLRPFSGFQYIFELIEVAAIVEPVDPGDKLWGIDRPGSMFYMEQANFDFWMTAQSVPAESDAWLRPARGYVGTTATQRWIMGFDPETMVIEDLNPVRNRIAEFRADVSRVSGGAVAANSFLPGLLDKFDLRSVVIGAPILAILALVVGGALYFLIYTAALTLEREGPEMALLRTRGASTWQTVGIHLAQSLVIAAIAAVVAPFVARWLVGITGRVPPLSDLTGGEPLKVAQRRPLQPFLIGGAALTFLSMGLAIIPFARRRVLELRSLAARPGGKSVWQRYNLDLFAIALSLVVLFQISQRGFINFSGDEAKLDPLAIVFPVLLLFTGALILLRILPWMLRIIGWVMTKSRSMSFALPGWHLGRNPIPYGRLALLVWLTTGLGAFALTYANTLESSFADRASFATGADVRVVNEGAGFLEPPIGTTGAAVLRTTGAPRNVRSRQAEVLAVRPADFAEVVKWRGDFGAAPQTLFGYLRPEGVAPDVGVELPVDATEFSIDGVVIPRSWADQVALGTREPNPDMRLMMKVFDARGQVWTMQADQDLLDESWQTVTVDLSTGLNIGYPRDPVPPLSIHAVWVERSNPTGGNVIGGESLLVRNFRAETATGPVQLDEAFEELTTLNGFGRFRDVDAGEAASAYFAEIPAGESTPTSAIREASPLFATGTAQRWALPGARTRVNPAVPQLRRDPDPINVLLDVEVAAQAGIEVGGATTFSIGGVIMDAELVGYIDQVPSMTDERTSGRMVTDLDGLSPHLNGLASWSYNTALARIEAPGELWIETDDTDAAIRQINAQLPESDPPDALFSIKANEAEVSSRPVQVGLVAILFVGAAVSVVLALAGVTSYVLLAVSRRTREMGVLRALGFGRAGVAATFAVEQVAVLGLGALIGTIGGIALMRGMLPFLQLGETAVEIRPAIRLAVAWPILLLYLGVVGILLIGSVIWATRRVSATRMSEVLREVER